MFSSIAMEEKYSYEKIKDIADYIQSKTSQRPKLGESLAHVKHFKLKILEIWVRFHSAITHTLNPCF